MYASSCWHDCAPIQQAPLKGHHLQQYRAVEGIQKLDGQSMNSKLPMMMHIAYGFPSAFHVMISPQETQGVAFERCRVPKCLHRSWHVCHPSAQKEHFGIWAACFGFAPRQKVLTSGYQYVPVKPTSSGLSSGIPRVFKSFLI